MAAVADLEAEKHVGEARDERRPETHEVPHRTPLVERDDSRLARRIVVLDRRIELLALVGDIAAKVLDVVRDLLGMVIRHCFLPRRGALVRNESRNRSGRGLGRPRGAVEPELGAEARTRDELPDAG